jgi:AraC-like DNA-binding protein
MADFLFLRHPPFPGIISCTFDSIGVPPQMGLLLRREFYETGSTTGAHLHHDFCALYVVKAGRGVHSIDGIPFGITRGDIYLMPPGATHTYLDYQNLEIDAFYFPLSLWNDDELAAIREISGFWHLFMESESRRFHLRPEAHQKIETAIAEMRSESEKNERATPILLRALLFRFLVMLARLAADEVHGEKGEVPSTTAPQLSQLLAWCEANVGSDISVAQLAGRMFFSPAHFARLFKREIGVPPATYLRRLRLERARTQLENSTQSVAQIALDSGFESAAHFSRTFRACYGASPLEFRRQSRK